jgi:hypothetical protein
MPTETIIVLIGVIAAFVLFAAVLTYGDLTWSKAPPRKDAGRH